MGLAGAQQGPQGPAHEVDREHCAERESRGLHAHVHDAEPEDLQREGAEAGEGIEPQPQAEGAARFEGFARVNDRGGRDWRGSRPRDAPAEDQGQQGGQEVRESGGHDRAPHAEMAQQDPGRHERAQTGAERVDAVQKTHHASGRGRVVQQAADQERERHAHEERGGQQAHELHEAADHGRGEESRRPHVEQVVEQGGARRAEEPDTELEPDEREESTRGREARAEDAAQVASPAESGHEGGHDDGDRVGAHARLQREQSLPGHLVDESGGSAQEKGEAGQGQVGRESRSRQVRDTMPRPAAGSSQGPRARAC